MKLSKEQVKTITRLAAVYKVEAERLESESARDLMRSQGRANRAAELRQKASEVLLRLAEDQAKPELKVINGGKEE